MRINKLKYNEYTMTCQVGLINYIILINDHGFEICADTYPCLWPLFLQTPNASNKNGFIFELMKIEQACFLKTILSHSNYAI